MNGQPPTFIVHPSSFIVLPGTPLASCNPMLRLLLASWLSLAPLQTPRQEVAVAAAGGRVYVFGGISGQEVLDSVEEYDPAANRWRFVAPLPEPLHHAAAATAGDAIYVIGGYRTLAFDPTDHVYRYDVLALSRRYGDRINRKGPKGRRGAVDAVLAGGVGAPDTVKRARGALKKALRATKGLG